MRTPPPNRPPDNLWFRLLIPLGFLFCATALSWVMTSFDRSGAPVVKWLNRYAIWLIAVEAVAISVVSVTAMAVDRRRSTATKTSSPDQSAPTLAAHCDDRRKLP
jgi:amino acid transporter